jgi:hypothetical protein
MSENTNRTTIAEAIIVFFTVVYNFAIVAGTTYLVVFYEWSMWCYLLAMCFMVSVKTGKSEEKT